MKLDADITPMVARHEAAHAVAYRLAPLVGLPAQEVAAVSALPEDDYLGAMLPATRPTDPRTGMLSDLAGPIAGELYETGRVPTLEQAMNNEGNSADGGHVRIRAKKIGPESDVDLIIAEVFARALLLCCEDRYQRAVALVAAALQDKGILTGSEVDELIEAAIGSDRTPAAELCEGILALHPAEASDAAVEA